jgi:hypothetical protein
MFITQFKSSVAELRATFCTVVLHQECHTARMLVGSEIEDALSKD